MIDPRFFLKPRYASSHALIIGINRYKDVGPLGYAVNDANGFKQALIDTLGFKDENICLLLDEQATKEAILKSYLRLSGDEVGADDRVIVFFAGHGDTRAGIRGDVGYLVPHDAVSKDLATYIRWDDFTRNSETVPAKHMLFIMDACYGGLALNRSLHAGSARFLKDMLLRISRQVLTAGKADEEVADAGGPLAGHSIFTGHLLEGLRGSAVSDDGVLTAAGLMSYVYSKVSNDRNSHQSPSYGHFDGDGDFILLAPQLDNLDDVEDKDYDQLMVIPYPEDVQPQATTAEKIRRVKSLLANDSSSIELHDVLVDELRRFLALTDASGFSTQDSYSVEKLTARVVQYEDSVRDLALYASCIAYWGRGIHKTLFQKIFSRSMDNIEMISGLSTWLELRNYPLIVEAYCTGIVAIEGGRYDSLAAMFNVQVAGANHRKSGGRFIDRLLTTSQALRGEKLFNRLPGFDRYHVPMSEHLYKILQPQLDDIFFIGRGYEHAFDEFEVLFALVCADVRSEANQSVWGPVGRFGWKAFSSSDDPLSRIIEQAKSLKEEWPPIKVGLFGGSFSRFESVATKYSEFVASLNLH